MAINSISELSVGSEVHYQPEHYKESDKFENGVVKEIRESNPNAVFVVYSCNGNWHRYQDYTSALTSLSDLNHGWRW